jgi:hypothetical protein
VFSSRRRHVRSASAAALVALLAAAATAQAAVVALPRVSAKTEQRGSGAAATLIVRSLLVRRLHGSLSVRCNRCRRLVGRIRVTRASSTSKQFSGVNWILRPGRAVKVTVTRRASTGRFLLLVARRRGSHLALVYKSSGCLKGATSRVLCPRGTPQPAPNQAVQVTPPPVAPPPPAPSPSVPAVPATSDANPCQAPVSKSWTSEPVQRCPLVAPLPPNGWVPVYARPVGRAAGAANPPVTGWLHGTAEQYFVCQREFPGIEYTHPQGYRNRWWAYTLSDENTWGWTPEVFFEGGHDDERDKGLAPCGPNHT